MVDVIRNNDLDLLHVHYAILMPQRIYGQTHLEKEAKKIILLLLHCTALTLL
jgi:hypothetical protein